MDLYELLKLAHVGAMIAWIGSGLGLLVLFAAAEAWHDEGDVLRVVKGASILGPTLSVPSGLIVLATGLGLAWGGGYGWEAWIVLSLLGVTAVFALGAGVVGPRLEWATLVWERDDDPEQALACGRGAMRIARLGQVIQFTVLALMVTRPGWEDVGALTVMAVLAAVAGGLAMRPAPGSAEHA
ncbi:hypothetical protein Rumeso_03619 [Rubellimicrobium mesophilum DSM 19309]|uniref:Integral membrane protein n=1 Tax=Rubellimicrobium mesophilum DSM 19309 TaxID=442562 RepID=A0A017HJW5_9RHOB|nr:DUF2269 family protein [Rubellimicrobium mesophilum]EYD74807.1 hypothetical protein Rumeso_03619 [Rubellimicrobium mesophilum DSM 19309]